jgi:hypothetical protein
MWIFLKHANFKHLGTTVYQNVKILFTKILKPDWIRGMIATGQFGIISLPFSHKHKSNKNKKDCNLICCFVWLWILVSYLMIRAFLKSKWWRKMFDPWDRGSYMIKKNCMMRGFIISYIHEVLLEWSKKKNDLDRACSTNVRDKKYMYNQSFSGNADWEV